MTQISPVFDLMICSYLNRFDTSNFIDAAFTWPKGQKANSDLNVDFIMINDYTQNFSSNLHSDFSSQKIKDKN